MSVDAKNIEVPADFEQSVNDAIVVAESKAGYKTTEFWVGVVASVLTALGTLPVPDHIKGVIVGAIGVAYIISRGIAKQGIPSVTPAGAVAATVVTTDSA